VLAAVLKVEARLKAKSGVVRELPEFTVAGAIRF